MKSLFITTSVAAAFIVASHLIASASGHMNRHSPQSLKVMVTYSFFIPGNTDTVESSSALHEKGRRMIYNIVSRECAVLRETIAATCRLSRLNVSQRQFYRKKIKNGVTISGHANYNVTLK